MHSLLRLYKNCRRSDTIFFVVLIKSIFYKIFYKKLLFAHQRVKIKGINNIETKEMLEIGIKYIGFMHKSDKTYLNIQGNFKLQGCCSIGRGCRIDIGRNATVTIGADSYINCNTKLIIMHNLIIGSNCAISWDCQILDEDFHKIIYPGKKIGNNEITIGNHVWIGCGTKIYKGTVIPDGCIISSDSVVKGIFLSKNSLIGGNPARVLKENINWQ